MYRSEGDYEKEKLINLKNNVSSSGFPAQEYNRYCYSLCRLHRFNLLLCSNSILTSLRPSHLAELMYEDLLLYLNQKFPKGSELAPFERERFLHTNYARSLNQVYLPPESGAYFVSLDSHASSNTHHPLVITGDVCIFFIASY